MAQMTGSQILVECLKEQGVDTIFGYPGGSVLNIYDELYRHQEEIRHILTSHEQGAAHAADGYARATGKVGVCLATSGPGATNLVTGIATAYMDSVPMVAITGNVPVPLLGKDSFQEVDITGITMPVTKHNFIVKDITKLADTLRRAFYIAQSNRPGPVLVDLTKDVTAASCEYVYRKPEEPEYGGSGSPEAVQLAVEMIRKASRPVIFVGGGAVRSVMSQTKAGGQPEREREVQKLRDFVNKVDAPITDSLMGKGAFDGTDGHYTGMLGMHGTKASNYAVSKCDLLIVIGARFSDRVTGNANKFASDAKILQIDIDPAEINKNVVVNHSVIGDICEVLQELNEKLPELSHPEWRKQVTEWKQAYPLSYPAGALTGPYIVEKVCELAGEDSVIVTEVGQHQMWAAQYYRYRMPGTLLTSGGLGTMGYGLGAAIGAKTGLPDRTVINMAGDGCFRMNMNEIATAARYNIGIIEIIFDNRVLGMVRQWQDLFYGQRYSQTTLTDRIDYVKLAEAMGAKAFLVESAGEFEPVLREAIAFEGPVVIDCRIGTDDKVWPMVAPGASIEEVFSEEDLH